MGDPAKLMKLSLVVPVFNEEESIPELIKQINSSLKDGDYKYEIIFIDDGSTDGSLDILKVFAKKDSHIKIYSFRKNLGKPSAMMLGFQKASGDYIVTLDADLQDDPKNIAPMIEKMELEKLDLVSGWRKNRNDSPLKVMSSKIFNKLVSVMFGIKINDLNCGLKLYRKGLAQELRLTEGMHRFIPVIAHDLGFRIAEKEVEHHPRLYGVSKYSSKKILTDIPDLFTIYFITKYTRRPLHFFGKVGSFLLLAGLAILFYLLIVKLQGNAIGNRPLLLFGVLIVLAGIQTIFTGLLADLIVNINSKKNINFSLKYQSE